MVISPVLLFRNLLSHPQLNFQPAKAATVLLGLEDYGTSLNYTIMATNQSIKCVVVGDGAVGKMDNI